MMMPCERALAMAAIIMACACAPAGAATTATNSGNWLDAAIWNNGVPGPGDDAYIPNGRTVTLTNSSAGLNSLTVSNGATLFFNGTGGAETNILLSATSVWVYGSITHGTNMANATNALGQWIADNRVWIACSNLTVGTNGAITTDGRGYRGGTNYTLGKGPGGTMAHVNDTTGGGGYGGKGGVGTLFSGGTTPGGPTYGSATSPADPGSGSGADHGGGFNGGGWICVEASGAITVFGSITANGQGGANRGGGGSGGAVNLACRTLEGNGLVTAHGGSSDTVYGSGGGGGGRIAVSYDATAQSNAVPRPTIVFGANQGYGTGGGYPGGYPGRPGTVSFPDTSLLSTNWQGGQIIIPGFSAWAPDNLTVSNGILVLPEAFDLSTTNSVRLAGPGGGLELTNSPQLRIGGDLILTNYGSLYLCSAATNGISPDYGTLVAVTGNVVVTSNSVVYPWSNPTNGGSVLFRMSNFSLALGGVVNADARGFAGGAPGQNGYGPGAGKSATGGGGYGGQGAGAGSGFGGTYGSDTNPIDPGSGGGGVGGAGGGLLRMEVADTATLSGRITANGAGASYGGSGGGINIKAKTFAVAYGTLCATGGTGSVKGGGGGRIALWYQTSDNFDGTISVLGGSTGGNTGQVGTIYLASAGGYTLTVRGTPVRHEVAVPYDYGLYAIGSGASVTDTIPLVAEQNATSRYTCMGWNLTNSAGAARGSGADTQAVFSMTEDLTLAWNWTNQYYLTAVATTNGDLVTPRTGWYTSGIPVTVTATADVGCVFLCWSGSGIPLSSATTNPLTVTMDRARMVQANFISGATVSRTWTGTGNWLSPTNWAPPGIPGMSDTVTVKSGTCTLTDPMTVGALTLSNGATLVFSGTGYYGTNLYLAANDVWVYGTVTHDANSATATNALGQWVPDNAIRFSVGNLTIATNGILNGDKKGFKGGTGYGPGCGPGRTLASVNGSTGGAGYGGVGGNGWSTVGGSTYGSTNMPLMPGSGSGADHGGGFPGGGLVWIECRDWLRIDGLITVNGEDSSNRGGGGSGGGVYATCRKLQGIGTVRANGGASDTVYGGGGGGGGRIAIAYIARLDSLTVTATNGVQRGTSLTGQPGTVMWVALAPPGTLFLVH